MDIIRKIYGDFKSQLKNSARKGAFHIFLGSFLTKFVAFFGSIFIIRILSKEEYGVLGYIENLFNYAYILAGLGLLNALLRYVILAKEKEEKHAYYQYILKFSTIFNIFLFTVACLFAIFYPHPEEFQQAKWLLPILLVSLPIRSYCDSQTNMLRAMFDNKNYAYFTCALAVAAIGGKILLALFFGIEGAIISPIIVYLCFAAVLGVYIHRKYFYELEPSWVLTKKEKRETNKYAIQYMITNSLWAIFMLNDVLLLGQLTGDAVVVAEYKVAYVLPANLSMISASIGIFIAPYFVKHENDHEWVRRSYKKIMAFNASVVGFVAILLYIFAGPVVSVLYGDEYLSVVPIMRTLLIAAFINNGLRYTNANLLASMGHIKYNLFISLVGAILQFVINIFVIPRFGSIGLAFTSVFIYLGMAFALTFVFLNIYFAKSKKDKNSNQ